MRGPQPKHKKQKISRGMKELSGFCFVKTPSALAAFNYRVELVSTKNAGFFALIDFSKT